MVDAMISIPERNYYGSLGRQRDALEYRLEGKDVIQYVVDQLRGGYKLTSDGQKVYNESFRLMNDLGISKVEMYLSGFANKIVHLTKYKNEDRVITQVFATASAFNFELTLNMKRWGPELIEYIRMDETEEEFKKRTGAVAWSFRSDGTVKYRIKVRNRRLVMQLVENALLASMQRGDSGFEGENTIKQIDVHEVKELGQKTEQQHGGPFSLFTGR